MMDWTVETGKQYQIYWKLKSCEPSNYIVNHERQLNISIDVWANRWNEI